MLNIETCLHPVRRQELDRTINCRPGAMYEQAPSLHVVICATCDEPLTIRPIYTPKRPQRRLQIEE